MNLPTPLLQIENVSRTFVHNSITTEVLRGVSLSISQGETVAIVGASGAGKTTLLHIMGALDRPTSGRLYYRGEDICTWDDQRLSRFRNTTLGFVFQAHHLLPEFSALENVMIPGIIAGRPRSETEKSARWILGELGLLDKADHQVNDLSGGEQQRIAVARALVMRPDVLLADEPTGNLDSKTGAKVEELLFWTNREHGTTVIVVTHDMRLAARMGRCVGIEDGMVKEVEIEGTERPFPEKGPSN